MICVIGFDWSSAGTKLRGDMEDDLYELLGVSRMSTEAQLREAYKKMALKHHPDRNRGSKEAAEKFKKVNAAFHILTDPDQRQAYDTHGGKFDGDSEFQFDVESLGVVGRVLGGIAGGLGVHVKTQVAPSVLTAARKLVVARRAGGGGRGAQPRPTSGRAGGESTAAPYCVDFPIGKTVSHKVERQACHFYWVTVSEAEAGRGVMVLAHSKSSSKFKLLQFDTEGAVVCEEVSGCPAAAENFLPASARKSAAAAAAAAAGGGGCGGYARAPMSRSGTSAELFFAPFERWELRPADWRKGRKVPELFRCLQHLTPSHARLSAGTHLLGVYGDNWMSGTDYSLTVLVMDEGCEAATHIPLLEARLRQKKTALEQQQQEYVDAQERLRVAQARVEEEQAHLSALLQMRLGAYDALVCSAVLRHDAGSTSLPPRGADYCPRDLAAAAAAAGARTGAGAGARTGAGAGSGAGAGAGSGSSHRRDGSKHKQMRYEGVRGGQERQRMGGGGGGGGGRGGKGEVGGRFGASAAGRFFDGELGESVEETLGGVPLSTVLVAGAAGMVVLLGLNRCR